MAIVTFMSDFGYSDHYVGRVKAKILHTNPQINIIDISHNIEHHNIAHGSFVLKYTYAEFPQNTVHLAAVNSQESEHYVALMLDSQYFVGPDNGLISMISDREPEIIVRLPQNGKSIFPTYDYLAPAAAQLATGDHIEKVGEVVENYCKLIPRQVKANKKQISGSVIRVNHFGNLITNIPEYEFNILKKDRYTVLFGREKLRTILSSVKNVEPGDCYLIFNELGLLEIGINKGNASELLGLQYDSPVHIIFDQ